MIMQRFKFCAIFILICVIVILLLAGSQHSYNKNYFPFEERKAVRIFNKVEGDDNGTQKAIRTDLYNSHYLYKLLKNTRSKIYLELRNYNFTSSGVNGLNDLLMNSGGQPIRSVIISTWRSGSSFLGQILNAMPANFYHYEPFFEYLHDLQIRDGPLADKALKTIKNLLRCNYYGLDEYFNNRKKYPDQYSPNTRLWDICKYNYMCYNEDFMTKLCRLFPFQSMKLVRFRLHLVKEILQDKKLNVRVVLLIRDPRGVLKSRHNLDFCELAPDCRMPERLCTDMISDYHAAQELIQQFPNMIKIIRYEELTLNPKDTTHQLYSFLRLGDLESVDKFLYSHTKVEVKGDYSIYRVTRNMPFEWKHLLDFNYVDKIQTVCKEAMSLWGYRMAYNASHMKSAEFYPLGQYLIQ